MYTNAPVTSRRKWAGNEKCRSLCGIQSPSFQLCANYNRKRLASRLSGAASGARKLSPANAQPNHRQPCLLREVAKTNPHPQPPSPVSFLCDTHHERPPFLLLFLRREFFRISFGDIQRLLLLPCARIGFNDRMAAVSPLPRLPHPSCLNPLFTANSFRNNLATGCGSSWIDSAAPRVRLDVPATSDDNACGLGFFFLSHEQISSNYPSCFPSVPLSKKT